MTFTKVYNINQYACIHIYTVCEKCTLNKKIKIKSVDYM